MENRSAHTFDALRRVDTVRRGIFRDRSTTTRVALRILGGSMVLGGFGTALTLSNTDSSSYLSPEGRQSITQTLQGVKEDLKYYPATNHHPPLYPNGVAAIRGIEVVFPNIPDMIENGNKEIEEPTVHRPLRTVYNALPYETEITRLNGKPISEAAIKPYWRIVNQAQKNVNQLAQLPQVKDYNANENKLEASLAAAFLGMVVFMSSEIYRQWDKIRPAMERKKTETTRQSS